MKLFSRFKHNGNSTNELLILYGTKTGNSKLIAQQTHQFYKKNGFKTICKNLAKFNPRQLSEYNKLLLIISTHGEGEPPPSSKKFFDQCMDKEMISLNSLNYSICALGDSSYDGFCQAGRTLDARFKELGAHPLSPRIDCDNNFSDNAVNWIRQTAKTFSPKSENKTTTTVSSDTLHVKASEEHTANIVQRVQLTSSLWHVKTYHIVLNISSSKLKYAIGDTLDIVPPNPQWLINDIATKLQLADTSLLKYKELSSLSALTIKRYVALMPNKVLLDLISDTEKLTSYASKANVLDLICEFPIMVSTDAIIEVLPAIRTRKYSIASSQKLYKNELHLTIKTIRYHYNQTNHEGAASVYATEFLSLNSPLKFKLSPNNSFTLPKQLDTPVIMIGVGTGIAPFRAILQEREALQAKGNTWILWGNKDPEHDFLYQDEIYAFQKNGILEKMNLVFSCNSTAKKYVHHVLTDNAETFMAWINKGAHVYICGSAVMGSSIKTAMEKVLSKSNYSIEALLELGRIHEDVY